MKIFVGNVDDRTTQEELSALFEKYGTVMSCAVMKQFAFVHMRDESRALAAIAALNGRELNGRKMVVELSKPRPQNTWKVFVGNVSTACSVAELRSIFEAYGRVVECDIVKDYAFVHMEKEEDAKEAIDQLNGKELKGRRINVELSTKGQKRGSDANGESGDKNRRSTREDSQTRSEDFELRRSLDPAYPQYAITSAFDQRAYLDAGRYDAYERQRSQAMYYGRDRSPMRRSPPLGAGYSLPTSALAAQYRAQSGVYGSQLASAYGSQASAALTSAYGTQTSAALAAAYGTSASALEAAYGSLSASSLANAYGTPSALVSAYGAQASSLAAAYGAQAGGSAHYSAHSPGTASPYSSQASAALAASYRQGSTTLGAYDSASQLAALAQQSSSYSAMSQDSPVETSGFERRRLSPPRTSILDAYRKSPDLLKRFGSDRRLTESEYRRLAESQVANRRSPPSQLEYRRPAEPHSDYANAYGDYLRAAQMQANSQRRL